MRRLVERPTEILFFLLLLLLPTQLGKHFFLDSSYIHGVKIDYLSIILYVTDILVLLLALVNFSLIKKSIIKNKSLILFLMLLFFANGFFSPHIEQFVYHLLKYIELCIVFNVARNTQLKQKIIIIALSIGAVVELVLSVLQLYYKSSLQGTFYFMGERMVNLTLPDIAKASFNGIEFLRPYGTFSHPNSMAGFYLLVYFFALSQSATNNKNKVNIIRLLLLFLSAALVVITFSKVAIITFVILNVITLLSKKGSVCALCRISRIVFLLVIAMIIFNAQTDPLSLQKRVLLLQHGLSILTSHLVWGTGLGQYLYFEAENKMAYSFFFLQPVHNSFLLFLTETGLLLGGFISLILYKAFRALFEYQSFLLCFGVLFLTGLFDHYWLTLQQNWLLMGVVFGLLLNNSFRKYFEQ